MSEPVAESLLSRIGYNAWRCVEAGPVPGVGIRRKAPYQASARRANLWGRRRKPIIAPDARCNAHMSVLLARKAGGWEQSGEFADGDTETGHGNGP